MRDYEEKREEAAKTSVHPHRSSKIFTKKEWVEIYGRGGHISWKNEGAIKAKQTKRIHEVAGEFVKVAPKYLLRGKKVARA